MVKNKFNLKIGLKNSILIIVGIFIIIFSVLIFRGVGNITGNYIYSGNYSDVGFAPPYNVLENNTAVVKVSPEYSALGVGVSNLDLQVNVSMPGGVVYNKGYYWNNLTQSWDSFTFSENTIGDSRWIANSASETISISKDKLRANLSNFVLTYSCKKYSDEWKCGCMNTSDDGCGFWSLQMFSVNITESGVSGVITTCEQLQDISNNLAGIYSLANNIDCDGFDFEPIGSSGYNNDCLSEYEVIVTEEYCNSEDDDGYYNCSQDCQDSGYAWNDSENICYSDYVETPQEAYDACSNTFTGELDGNGFEITGLNINRPTENNVGLFGYVQNAKISNLKLENVSIIGKSSVGGFVGFGDSEIVGSGVSGKIVSAGDNFNQYNFGFGSYAGGLVGSGSVLIDSSFFEGAVDSFGKTAGGLVGSGSGKIIDSYVIANISAFYSPIGGLVGIVSGAPLVINNSYVVGDIYGKRADSAYATYYAGAAGGLIGDARYNYATIYNSFSVVNITNAFEKMGEVVGYSTPDYWSSGTKWYNISSCYVNGPAGKSQCDDNYKNSFKNTKDISPVNSWDFENVWQANANGYPTLK